MIADETRRFYATQFHLEVVHTPHGAALLRNFVRKIAGCRGDWTMRAFKEEAIEKIRAQVGKGRVICGLSGGVDSAVAAVLIHEAIGDAAHLRVRRPRPAAARRGREGASRCSADTTIFRSFTLMHLRHFCRALAGVTDPEEKRKTIGKLFIDVFEAEAKKLGRRRRPSSWRRARSIPT